MKTNYDHVGEDDGNVQTAMPAAKRGFYRDEDFEDGIGFTAKVSQPMYLTS